MYLPLMDNGFVGIPGFRDVKLILMTTSGSREATLKGGNNYVAN